MDRSVGATLREARRRRRVELSEVEAATRIRSRYLRAMEDEDWEALPEGVYTRAFIRTYASFLGLDGERLAAEHRRSVEAPAGAGGGVSAAAGRPSPRPRRRVPGASWLVAAGVLLLAALVIVALPVGEDGGGPVPQPTSGRQAVDARDRRPETPRPAPRGVSVSLTTSAEVWICLLDHSGQALVDGQVLGAGAGEGPFHSGSFTVSFGNGEVAMLVNGKEAEIPGTSSPIGYSIDGVGELTRLSEAERPTCT